MIITPIEHGLDLAHSYSHRSEGAHMSTLFNSYYAKMQPKRYAHKEGEDNPRERWGIGMAFEEMLEEGLKRRLFNTRTTEHITRPGEFETEHTATCPRKPKDRTPGCGCVCGGGIAYSPDLLIFNGVDRVGEIKLNTMSAKGIPWRLGQTYSGFDAKYDKYFSQIKLYCYHLGTVYARLYSFSVREMVYFNEKNIFRAWDIQFTPSELAEEWDLIHRHSVAEGLLVAA